MYANTKAKLLRDGAGMFCPRQRKRFAFIKSASPESAKRQLKLTPLQLYGGFADSLAEGEPPSPAVACSGTW
jgi:hypothetical protein